MCLRSLYASPFAFLTSFEFCNLFSLTPLSSRREATGFPALLLCVYIIHFNIHPLYIIEPPLLRSTSLMRYHMSFPIVLPSLY